MSREQIKSQRRREAAKAAITALGIPGVCTTRNLEAWLIAGGGAAQNAEAKLHGFPSDWAMFAAMIAARAAGLAVAVVIRSDAAPDVPLADSAELVKG